MKTYEDGIQRAGYLLDELFSMTEDEISSRFEGKRTAMEVVDAYPIPEIMWILEGEGENDSDKESTMDDPWETPKRKVSEKENEKAKKENGKLTLDQYLRKAEEFPVEEIDRVNAGGRLKGTVVWIDKERLAGLVMHSRKKVLHKVFITNPGLSTTAVNSLRRLRQLYAGDIISFSLMEYEGRTYAWEIQKEGHASTGRQGIDLPGGQWLDTRHVTRYGKKSGLGKILRDTKKSLDEIADWLHETGHTWEDFEYVYIKTPKREFRIFRETSPISGDGQTSDLDAFLEFLDRKVIGFHKSHGGFMSEAEAREKEEQKKKEKEDRTRGTIKRTGFADVVTAGIMTRGFPKEEAKELVRQYGLTKKLKKNPMEATPGNVRYIVEDIVRKKKPKKPGKYAREAFHIAVKGYIKAEYGATKAEMKKKMNAFGFGDKLVSGEIKDTDDAKEIAERIFAE